MNQEEKNSAGKPGESAFNTSKEQSATFPVIEEEVQIGKRVVETGKVHLSKKVYEEEETLELPETREEVSIERIPVNQYVDSAPPAVRQEGDTTIYPVLKEVAVVEKKLMLVEEVRITKRQSRSTSTQKVSLRKEEVKVNRQKNDLPSQEHD